MADDTRRLGRDPRVRATLLALAAIGGWLDGLTFVALGTVFVTAVTGDLVQLGISIADGRWSALAVLVAALAAFMLGTVVSVVLVRAAGARGWPGPVRRPLFVHAALLLVFAACWTAIGDPQPESIAAVLVVAVAAASAGIQAAIVVGLGIRGANVSAVTTVLILLAAGFAEREGDVPGPRSDLPLSELFLILAVYCASGLVVALALSEKAGVLAWVPAAVAIAVIALVPRRDPKLAPG
ncbi:MAG: YoaK family protein [Solirubrobacterales bacterium]|nr:DUF1275 domain-containing protein [Solirubrobacterales bacterium]